MVIIGEGRIDKQTPNGKVISEIVKTASQYNVPVIAITVSINDLETINDMGVNSAFCIANKPMSLKESKLSADILIENLSSQIGNLLKLSFK